MSSDIYLEDHRAAIDKLKNYLKSYRGVDANSAYPLQHSAITSATAALRASFQNPDLIKFRNSPKCTNLGVDELLRNVMDHIDNIIEKSHEDRLSNVRFELKALNDKIKELCAVP